jgi:hypothetical protein
VPLWELAILGAATSKTRRKTMLGHLQKLSGIPALITIVVLGVLGLFLAGVPMLRRIAWGGVALVAVLAAINEWRR